MRVGRYPLLEFFFLVIQKRKIIIFNEKMKSTGYLRLLKIFLFYIYCILCVPRAVLLVLMY